MTELLTVIREILQLGFPAIVLLQVYIIWQQYISRTDEHIKDLRYIASIRYSESAEAWNGGTRPPLVLRSHEDVELRQPSTAG